MYGFLFGARNGFLNGFLFGAQNGFLNGFLFGFLNGSDAQMVAAMLRVKTIENAAQKYVQRWLALGGPTNSMSEKRKSRSRKRKSRLTNRFRLRSI